jgi:uncharacterized cupredoxin-like copper-binding protein
MRSVDGSRRHLATSTQSCRVQRYRQRVAERRSQIETHPAFNPRAEAYRLLLLTIIAVAVLFTSTVLVLAAVSHSTAATVSGPVATALPSPVRTAQAAAAVPEKGGTVNVTLTDMHISVDRTSILEGSVIFVVKNSGAVVHEFVVLHTDVPQDKLVPDRAQAGKVDETGNVGETGEVNPGESKTFTITIPAGAYVLLCNEVGHYAAGMHLAFTVAVDMVNATLTDMHISIDRTNVSEGPVTFVVKNNGAVIHEFDVIRTDVPQDKLPMDPNQPGKVDETGNVGETGEINPGESQTFTITLPAGHYVIMCNEAGHYAAGMHLDFTVD